MKQRILKNGYFSNHLVTGEFLNQRSLGYDFRNFQKLIFKKQ